MLVLPPYKEQDVLEINVGDIGWLLKLLLEATVKLQKQYQTTKVLMNQKEVYEQPVSLNLLHHSKEEMKRLLATFILIPGVLRR